MYITWEVEGVSEEMVDACSFWRASEGEYDQSPLAHHHLWARVRPITLYVVPFLTLMNLLIDFLFLLVSSYNP